MSTCHSCKWAEEPSAPAGEEDELPQRLTTGDLTDPHQLSIDPQQTTEVFTLEHLGDQNARAHGPQTVPVQVQSPIGAAGAASTSMLVYAHHKSDSGHNLGGVPDESDHVSPDEGATENEDDLMNLKDNADIVLMEAMEATERLNTVFNHIRTYMNRMFPMMKELLVAPKPESSGKTIEPENNRAHDKAAAKAATE
ncbi:hypothetical protein M422DRAFT_256059 [Sphaerobolus stellatus SS14]|uniref:Uncharacterized protein n=1 Tax=Sphaerobolus stellatus (strain SS14) TaxID=990650 RepID=A0A0C9UCQ3_SPHS4|nr:hypothetical protein M422DRAFT_256059 [Sphaerobolus stellatus SS14]